MGIARNLNRVTGGRRVHGVPSAGIIASQIISETATGDSGAGLLHDAALLNPGKQLRLRVTSLPSSGVVTISENGAIIVDFTGAPEAIYTLGYDEFADNVFYRADTATFTVGAVVGGSGSAPGGVGTSSGSGSGGDAFAGLGKFVLLTLVDPTNVPRQDLTNLKWCWFDQVTPDLFLSPTDQGNGETTNASGNLVVQIPNSALSSGQVGWMLVTNSDGTTGMSHQAFSGPVVVS